MSLLDITVRNIPTPDKSAAREAGRRLDRLTKPPGSMGRLEELAIGLASMQGRCRPDVSRKVVFTLAADHGVTAKGVSAYPRDVTAQMVQNFLRGGAAINVLARLAGAQVVVADFGVAAPPPAHPALRSCRVGAGTRDLSEEPAMSRDEARRSIELGIGLVGDADLIGTGEMGIGNTTSASALTAGLTGRKVEEVTGRGTGVDDAGRARKIDAIQAAFRRSLPDPLDPLGLLASVGGFEIGGLVGVILGAAARRIPVLLDGFIATSAGLVATALAPASGEFLLAAHQSVEPGHVAALTRLGLRPILDLSMRLGEGTGAALAMLLCEAACRILGDMATFDEAGVSGGGT
jgi:nicotinate-nucleotide--dimethylbenzimidazole phosphoribosyltransferase